MTMIDGHVHIERVAYTKEWLLQFVNTAIDRGIRELYILEHSYRFVEFREASKSIVSDKTYGKYQRDWLNRKSKLSINEFKNFVSNIRLIEFPINVRFGLEVCYFPEQTELIGNLLADYNWDFLTGSIHWIDGWGFDHPNNKSTWKQVQVNEIYQRYYELMINLVESKIFHILAHPDSIKCFNVFPTMDMTPLYDRLSRVLHENKMIAEFSCGLRINYNHNELGVNKYLLDSFMSNEVEMITASDAHRPEDVGRFIDEANKIITRRDINSKT